MGFNVKSLYSNNAGKSNNTTTKQSSFNVRSLNDQVFEIKLNDNKTIGNISYGAKKAIENNTLDSYTPKNEEEKKSLETYKKWTGYGKTYDTVKSQYEKDKYGKGNIDLTNRPVFKNIDGTISTVESISINENGKEILIPTVIKDEKGRPKRLSDEDAIKHYRKTGEYLGKFNTVEEADEYAQSLHIDQEWFYSVAPDINTDEQKVFDKYNLNPMTFSQDDYEKWALEHGYEFNYSYNGNGDDVYLPKYKNGKLVPTAEEQADFKILSSVRGRENVKDAAKKYPATFSTATVLGAPIITAASILANEESIDGLIKGNGVATNSAAQNLVKNTDLVRETVTNEHASKWFSGASGNLGNYGALTYNGLMSIGDTVMTSLTLKKIGTNMGLTGKALTKFTSNTTSGLLASKSMQSTIQQKKKDGLSDDKAVAVGLATGMAEFITEKYSLEAIFKTPSSVLKKGVISFLAEGSEEMASDMLSKTADYFIAGNDSDIKKNINKYFQNGMSKKSAVKQATVDSIWETLSAGAVGGLSGVAISSAYHGFGKPEIKRLGADYRDVATDIIQSGLESPENTTAYKHAEKLSKKGIDNISDYEIGLQHTYNVEQIEYEEAQEEKAAKKTSQKTQSKNTVVDTTEETPHQPKYQIYDDEDVAGTVSVGEAFIDAETNNIIEVIGRNESATELKITTPNGETETMSRPNESADRLAVNDKYSKVDISAQNTEDVLQNQSKSDTINEKNTNTVPNADKSRTVAYTNDNQQIDLSYKVISADDLIVSNDLDGKLNPNYPQELQPRDRSRVSSQSQIRQMANELNPARLAESTSVSEGSPIVGTDNVVESGNGRTLAIKLAYQMGIADNYKNYIISNADRFGIDVSNLPENPVLVRERLTEVDRTEFTRKANESTIGSLSATEQAKVDAEKLTDNVLNSLVANDEGELNTVDNRGFISSVINNVFKSEDLNNVVNAEGMLSARGLERIKNAIFYKAYGDASLSARLSESLDNDMKNATKVLLNIAPKVVSIKNGIASGNLYDFDFSADIVNAIRLFEKCRNDKLSIEDYALQTSLFEKEPQLVMAMANVFETKNRGAKQATDFYNLLLDTVLELGNPNQMSLDVFETYQTKEEILDAAIQKFNTGVEPKNTIAIPESIYQSTSEKGRENDGRGIDEVSRNELNQNETIEPTDRIQQDNGPSEETRVATNDEQLRQKNESVEGKSEVETSDTESPDYNHLYDEKKVSKEYLDSVNSEIENAIINIRNGNIENIPDVINVTELDEKTIKAISDFVGYDISGYACKIERDRLVHIENRHGINGEHDQSLSDPKDTARMGYVVNNSDNIDWAVDGKGNRVFDKQYNDKNNKPSPVIMLNSKIDGTYCVSQAVPDSKKKTVWITSVRIQKKAAVGSQVPYDSNATPQLQTSETPLNSSSASADIVSQSNDVVNSDETTPAETNSSIKEIDVDALLGAVGNAKVGDEIKLSDYEKQPSSESDTIEEKETTETPGKLISKGEASKQIADYVADKLAKGEKISAMELSLISSKAFGGTMANNAFSIKDAYDAMELGVNQHILSMKEVSADKMLEILELIPTQTKRTEEMVKFQQFSTPPSIAYLANYTANVNANDIMLEPSAGIGGIAVFAKKDGATVYVNELDNRRLEVLKNMPFDGFFNENAEQLDNILGGEIEPTVIVMNPPFSSSSERNMKNTKIGAKHIEQALKILAPNGRLVAIVGNGMADGAPAFRTWWNDIKSQYNVRANIGVNGKNYNKYGTSFDIQILVIDKNGPTTQPTVTAYVDTLQELQEKLGGIRDERPTIDYSTNEQRTPATTRKETATTEKRGSDRNSTLPDTSSGIDKGKFGDTSRTSGKSNVQDIQSTDADRGKSASVATENTDVVADENGRVGSRQSDGLVGEENTTRTDNVDSGQSDVQTRRTEPRKRIKKKELTDSIFEQYQTQTLRVKNAKPHPARVSESAAMSAIEPPTITYKPNIPQDIIDKGVVSDVQLEAISYAGQSHSQVLPNGTTRGFFLGDGTGIGKGRTIAGMMLDNYNQGRKKAVWVTLNSSLVNDAKRDVKALFGDSDLVMQFEGGEKANKIFDKDEAILVVSYSTLSRAYDNKDSNFEKIIKWLGKDYDGLIVFDEAHKMGNATSTKGTRGVKKASQTGISGIALQEALPKARVVYSSATGATEVENLRYAERLGLWGEGTPFIKGDDFVSKVKAGGLAAMELIARDMKAMGVYLSRNISYDDVRYDKITHKLTAQQTKIYDELARSWQIVLNNINKALESTNQDKDGHARGRALGAFWSSQQRFFNQILTSMQVPSVIADIEKQLADGKSCVIQLVSTNEAAQNQEFERLKSEDLDLDEFDLTPKQVLMSLIENSFPVQQFEEYVDEKGNKRSKPVYDSKGNPVINRDAVRQRDALLDKLGSIKVPSSPIDMIINHFGTDLVAENTGRARRVIQKDGKTIEEKIGNKKDADVDAFQNGNKRIIIFSKAGGTGKSYHADRSAKNQQQRVHYLLEAGWQADNAVQGFGRSHRSNQASAPIFKLVTTNLKGQMRFISTIAKRLDQLGAMTKGQRQAGSQGMFSASDNLENSFAADVLAVFYKDLISNRVDGIDDGLVILDKLGLKNKILDEYNRIIPTAPELREVNKFLNRILSLESNEQNTIFEGYSQRLQDATEKAMQAGTLDKGLENYKADKITLNEVQDIREDESSGARTKYYNLTAEHKIKPITFESIQTDSKSFVGFYQNKNTGNVRAVMRTTSSTDQYGNVTQNYKLVGQVKNEYIAQHRLYGNWVEIKADEAEKLWNEELTKLPEYRKENLHLISGVVLPVWDKLPTENVRIYRVLTSDGEMLIGRVISEDMIDETLRRLGSSRKKEKIATKDLVAGIKNGDKVYLENDWMLTKRKVAGEDRIELMGPSYEHHDMLMEKGVFAERIQYRTRYFVPADTNTEKIIDDILKLSPVMRVENDSTSSGVHYSKQSMQNASDTESRWTANRVDSDNGSKKNNDKIVRTADIVNAIREKFDIPVATGKVTSPLASAQYNEKAESIRTRIANNLPDISHELGHHLDKKYGFSNFESVEELQKVVPVEFLDQYDESEWNAESVSWFVEKYLQSTDNANRLCSDFYADFVSSLSKEDLKSVNEIANSVNEYMAYDFSGRVRASIVSGDVKEKTSLSEKAKKMHADWVDGFLPIKDVVEYVEQTTGVSLSGGKNAYTLATNHLNARAIANFNTVHGFRDLNGNIVEGAKSYIECIANVNRKDLETLDEYLVLKHSLEWISPQNKDVTVKRVFADDTLENVESIERRIAEIEEEHPEMKEASDNLYEYQRNTLKHIVIPAGGMTEATYNSLNEKYPNYVPFYRAVGKDGAKTKGTFANQKSPLKRAKGSGELIISPLESIIKNTDKMVKFALRNQTMQVLTNYADTVDGFGKFMERVPPDMMPRIVDISQQKEKFADALQQAVSTSDDYFAVSDLLDNIFGDAVTDFTPIANANKKIVTVMKNGEFAYYQIHDEDLYSAIAEFTPTKLEGIFALSNRIMQPMKMLITQNNPIFATTNMLRDVGTAYKHSPINNPVEFSVKYLSALKEIITKGDLYKEYQAMGGGHNSELSANIDQLKQTLRRVSEKDMGKARRLLYSIVCHPVATTASLNDYIESVPRVMEFIRTLESGGDLQEAIYNADDITTNFKRSGRHIKAKQINAAIMFNNASLQGLDKTYRTLTNKNKAERTKTLLKWALSALIIAALESLWNKTNDDEGYENLSSYKKNNFYNFSVGDGIFISLPKARETALLDSFTERTIEYVFGNNDAFYNFGEYVAQQLLPPMLPDTLNPIDAVHDVLGSTVIGGISDVIANKNYMDVPIEGKYDTFLPSNERYNEKTTKVAYELGQTKLARMADLSPKKIDHLISTYTGVLGQINKALLPMNKENRDATVGLRNKFISDSNYSTDLLNKAYDNTDKAKQQWQYDNNINNAIEYEQNAEITSYISGMNKAIKALPEDEQREGRKYLLKALNNWSYDLTTQQSNMQSKLENESISKDCIFEELPSSEISWTVDTQKYTYQMTPQEYNKYISDYLKVIENARKKYGGNSPESYAKAKEAAKDYMSEYKKSLKNKYLKKATKGE